MRHLLFLALATALAAAEPIGVWRFGLGTVDGQPARVGTVVLSGQTLVSADAAPMRLSVAEAPGTTIVLAAGTTGRLNDERQADGTRHLVLELDQGAAQVDVADKGPFGLIVVRGAACEVRVLGTLFVVERVHRDRDYLAMARGRVQVALRPGIAAATGRSEPIELTERPGVSAGPDGFSPVEALSSRPQLHMAAALREAVQAQALGTGTQGTADWGSDLAGDLTGLALEQPIAPPELTTEVAVTEPPPIPFSVIAEELSEPLADLGGAAPVQEQVLQGAPAAAAAPLPPPPGPP
jgi:hypothetical protein